MNDKFIIEYFSDNKLFATKEHFDILIKKALKQRLMIKNTQNVHSERKILFDKIKTSINALVISGYVLTNIDHQILFEYLDIITDNLIQYLDTLMKKTRLSDDEYISLSKLAYLYVLYVSDITIGDVLYCDTYDDGKANKNFNNVNIKTNLSLVKIIYAFYNGSTVNQISKIILPEHYTVDMLNVVISMIKGHKHSTKRTKEYIKLFRDNNVYPDFHTFRILHHKCYNIGRNYLKPDFKSIIHRQIYNYMIEIYSE
jgi:hypothetical protein